MHHLFAFANFLSLPTLGSFCLSSGNIWKELISPLQGTSSSHSDQESNNHQQGGARRHGTPPPFTMPFNINTSGLPTDFASMLMNMTANAYQGQPSQNRQGDDGTANESDGPGIRIGGNINLDFGEQMPEQLTEAFRSMMDMFSGASQQQNSDGSANGSSTAS